MKTSVAAIGALLALPAVALLAQDLETIVVTGSRGEQPLRDLVGNTFHLDADTLDLVDHTHIQESLARIPGANVGRGNGQEYLPALRSPVLSGAEACGSILAAMDGIPLRAAGFCNINELFDAQSESAAAIEVIRGPGNALFGSNALHGVVNIITPRVAASPETTLGVEYGPHDFGRVAADLSQPGDTHGLRATFNLATDGGYQDDSGYGQQKMSLRHEYQQDALAVATTLAITNLNQETAGYITGFEAYKDDDQRNDNENPEAFRDAFSARLASRIDYTQSSTTQWSLTPYLRYTDMDFLQHFLPGAPLEENGQKSIGLQPLVHHQPTDALKLIGGIDMEFTDAFLKQSQEFPTQGSAFLRATIPVGKHYDYQVDAGLLAPFVQGQWQVAEQVTLSAGVRYEVMAYDYDNRMLDGRGDENGAPCGFDGCRYSRPADSEDDFENWSPNLGLLYRVDDDHQLYLNIAYGFRAPQATELYRLQRAQTEANLDSEQLGSVELGFRGQQQALSYELIVYAMKKQNAIYRDTDFFNVPEGKTRHRGVEFALAYDFATDWQFALAANLAQHEYANDWLLGATSINGNDVDSAPHHFGSAHLRWRFLDPGVAELEWLHQGAYYTDPENRHDYDGHDLLNLRLRWQANNEWQVQGRIANLLDTDYAERADYTNITTDRYFPGEPRAFYLGIERRW